MASDLRAWAEKTAPTMTDEEWAEWESLPKTHKCELHTLHKAWALLAYVEELARGLTPRDVELMRGSLRGWPMARAVLRARARLGLD